ncbi:MAG: hypothetical protein ACOCX5_03140 [Chloroflexota bacterium]
MQQPLSVRKVESKADFKAFFKIPWKVYQGDPNWVPPLLSIRRELLDKDKNPSWEYLEGDYFVAWRGEQPVGTIAAFVNHRHNEYHNEHVAWFGFFEVLEDEAAAQALLQTAINWATAGGYEAIRGPQSFTTHEECGLLIDGFEQPVMLMPYNPPYYQAIVENGGFHKVMDTYSLIIRYDDESQQKGGQIDLMQRAIARIKRNNDAQVRTIDRKNMRQDFELFKSLYNQAWEKNWGFVPMTDRELDALIDSLVQFFDPELACFVEVNGEPAGFMLAVPDFNQVLKYAYPRPGTPESITLIKALWHWKIRPKIDRIRIPLLGIKAEYRTMGLDLLLYNYLRDLLTRPDSRYDYLDAGWVLETNNALLGILDRAGMERYRTYRFYERKLTSAAD